MQQWCRHLNVWNIRLSRDEINVACGCMIEGKLPMMPLCPTPVVSYDADQKNRPLCCDTIANCVYESEIPINEEPRGSRVIRMTKKSYVDDFFEHGLLKLGSLSEYAQAEHSEIGDKTEGMSIAVVQSSQGATLAFELNNADCVALCTYAGEPDSSCIENFGYDSCFEIVDPEGFAKAIAEAISADKFDYSECVYSEDKVIVVENFPSFDPSRISMDTYKSVAGMSRFFVKPDVYSHQCEFRFVWHGAGSHSRVIECPEAIQYCRRVDL